MKVKLEQRSVAKAIAAAASGSHQLRLSKTINLSADATHGDVEAAYSMALSESERGAVIKGVTVYRDESQDEQVKSTSKEMQGDDVDNMDSVEVYQSGEWSDEDVREFMDKMEDVVGGDAAFCPECDEGVMQAQEGCELCPTCGYPPCA